MTNIRREAVFNKSFNQGNETTNNYVICKIVTDNSENGITVTSYNIFYYFSKIMKIKQQRRLLICFTLVMNVDTVSRISSPQVTKFSLLICLKIWLHSPRILLSGA